VAEYFAEARKGEGEFSVPEGGQGGVFPAAGEVSEQEIKTKSPGAVLNPLSSVVQGSGDGFMDGESQVGGEQCKRRSVASCLGQWRVVFRQASVITAGGVSYVVDGVADRLLEEVSVEVSTSV